MYNIHVMLAAAWAAIAIGLVIWSLAEPARDQLMLIIVTGILAFYNLARWLAARKRVEPPQWAPRRRHKEDDEPPNPEFDFSNDPSRK